MREILFRGKSDSNKWIYGDLMTVYDEENYRAIQAIEIETPRGIYRVDPETVCQYTGLNDKNGKKIFEGDIISTPKYGVDNGNWKNCAGKDRFLVRYADGTYYLENKLRRFCLRPDSTCGIIGNIFDNPELIASKKGAEA